MNFNQYLLDNKNYETIIAYNLSIYNHSIVYDSDSNNESPTLRLISLMKMISKRRFNKALSTIYLPKDGFDGLLKIFDNTSNLFGGVLFKYSDSDISIYGVSIRKMPSNPINNTHVMRYIFENNKDCTKKNIYGLILGVTEDGDSTIGLY